jgi:hypothetical protein
MEKKVLNNMINRHYCGRRYLGLPGLVCNFILLIVLSLCFCNIALAGFAFGYVFSREEVKNDAGNYTWSEYNPTNGAFEQDIGEATGPLDPSIVGVMSGDEYRLYITQKEKLHSQYEDKNNPNPLTELKLYSREGYENATLYLADGQTQITKPQLAPATAYVSVLPQALRLIDDPSGLILGEYPINPETTINGDTFSLLYKFSGSGMGQVVKQSKFRIGFKTAFAKDSSGNPVPVDDWVKITGGGEYKAVGPISNAKLEGPMFSTASTNNEGFFKLAWTSIPCFGLVGYSIDSYITMTLQYRRFNPRDNQGKYSSYYDLYPVYEGCTPSFYMVPYIGPYPTGYTIYNSPMTAIQFAVDLTIISGTAQLSADVGVLNRNILLSRTNKVPVGLNTAYQVDAVDNTKIIAGGQDYDGDGLYEIAQHDFDRDGVLDIVIAGHYLVDANGNPILDANGNKQFIVGAPEEIQAVWLSSNPTSQIPDNPDLTRVMDSASFANFTHQGLLSEISEEDLKNTDIYVVRLSDGKLIAERIGLNERNINDFGGDSNEDRFYFTMQMRGSKTSTWRQGVNFETWQSKSGINPELHKRQADHLQPGDAIRIFAINRATGYIGHGDTKMKAGRLGDDISFQIPPIIMGPPNLKVRVEREFKIDKGATKSDDDITRLIGFEGASLTSDNKVTVITEWLDHQGRPMPASLAGAGYTGRIAILSTDRTLATGNQGVYQFSIDPGLHRQVLQLPNNVATDAQHYYLHISGEPQKGNPIFANNSRSNRKADFSLNSNTQGILQKRPGHYVPFLTPVFDEAATELQMQAYRQINANNPGQIPEKPDPIYRWVYRPEMQYSTYKFDRDKLQQERNVDTHYSYYSDETNIVSDLETNNILNDQIPLIFSESTLKLFFDLKVTQYQALDYFNAGSNKELIFAIGEQEVTASIGENKEIVFDNLESLEKLNPDGLLTLRLYANNDVGNILWEWAFDTPLADKIHEVDNPCNWVPNRKQGQDTKKLNYHPDYSKTLFVVYEPDIDGHIEVLLDGVSKSDLWEFMHIYAVAEGFPIESAVEAELTPDPVKDQLNVSFEIDQSIVEDTKYRLMYYIDVNNNNVQDLEEGSQLLPVKYRQGDSSGDIEIMVSSIAGYNRHDQLVNADVNEITKGGIGRKVFDYFYQGGPSPALNDVTVSGHNLTYLHEQLSAPTDSNTGEKDNLLDSWTHGAGVQFNNPIVDELGNVTCEADVPEYIHNENSELSILVHQSLEFPSTLLKTVYKTRSKLIDANKGSATEYCSAGDTEPKCYKFEVGYTDIDIDFVDATDFDGSDGANLGSAIGAAKIEIPKAVVRMEDGTFIDTYDIKLTGFIYDFYDFNIGKLNGILCPNSLTCDDFNTDGGWLQIGYEANIRDKGAVFVTKVPFTFYLSLSCGLLDCTTSTGLLISQESDF